MCLCYCCDMHIQPVDCVLLQQPNAVLDVVEPIAAHVLPQMRLLQLHVRLGGGGSRHAHALAEELRNVCVLFCCEDNKSESRNNLAAATSAADSSSREVKCLAVINNAAPQCTRSKVSTWTRASTVSLHSFNFVARTNNHQLWMAPDSRQSSHVHGAKLVQFV